MSPPGLVVLSRICVDLPTLGLTTVVRRRHPSDESLMLIEGSAVSLGEPGGVGNVQTGQQRESSKAKQSMIMIACPSNAHAIHTTTTPHVYASLCTGDQINSAIYDFKHQVYQVRVPGWLFSFMETFHVQLFIFSSLHYIQDVQWIIPYISCPIFLP